MKSFRALCLSLAAVLAMGTAPAVVQAHHHHSGTDAALVLGLGAALIAADIHESRHYGYDYRRYEPRYAPRYYRRPPVVTNMHWENRPRHSRTGVGIYVDPFAVIDAVGPRYRRPYYRETIYESPYSEYRVIESYEGPVRRAAPARHATAPESQAYVADPWGRPGDAPAVPAGTPIKIDPWN